MISITSEPEDRHKVLPAEIWVDIFDLVLGERDPYQDGTTSPQEILAICEYWKDIMEHTPTLWCEIYMQLSYERLDTQVADLESWLEHAGQLSLSIRLRFNKAVHTGMCYDGILDTLFQCLLKYSSRIKVLDSLIFQPWFLRLQDKSNQFKLLSTLVFRRDLDFDWLTFQYKPQLILDELQFPNLQEVHLMDEVHQNRITISNEKVTTVKTMHTTASRCISKFISLPSVQHCSFSQITAQPEHEWMGHETFCHDSLYTPTECGSNLLSLEISVASPYTIAYLLSRLRKSDLTSLTLQPAWHLPIFKYPDAIPSFHRFLFRVLPNFANSLECLSLGDAIYDQEALLSLCNALPKIRDLKVASRVTLNNEFIFGLTTTFPSSPQALPRLRAIELDAQLEFHDEALLAFVESRMKNLAPSISTPSLESISLCYRLSTGPFSQKGRSRILEAMRKGLRFTTKNRN